jgi:hypothetical protein
MKNLFVLFSVVFIFLAYTAFAKDSSPSSQTGDYKIGDTGPAGGIIFLDKGNFSDGWRYMEAAPSGNEFKSQWSNKRRTRVDSTMTTVGSGMLNTQAMVDILNREKEYNCAAQLCAATEINGYKGWFLPSKDELDLMYKNLKARGLGGFRDEDYWSSSQDGKSDGSCQNFKNGRQHGRDKDNTYLVRPIRAF